LICRTILTFHSQTLTTLQLCNNKMDRQEVIHLANALKQNKVRSSFCFFHSIHCLIDDHYTWYWTQSNQWWRNPLSCQCFTAKSGSTSLLLLFFQSLADYFTQTLIKLSLQLNEIGPQGAEHLADALQQNQVTLTHSTFSFSYSLTILHRRWPGLTSISIKLVMREHNILPRLYNKIK
jgi:hypothetical protein